MMLSKLRLEFPQPIRRKSADMKIPIVETERLVLRAHEPSDFDASYALWSDETVVRFIGGVPSTKQEVWSRLLRYSGLWAFLGFGYWAAVDRETGQFVGDVGFADFKRELDISYGHLPEAGWAISPRFAGRGYATEAMRGAYQWLDQATPQSLSFCLITPGNDRSINVSRKLGFAESCSVDFNGSPSSIYVRSALTDGHK